GCADPSEDDNGFVESLRSLAETLNVPVPVFPIADPHLYAIAKNFERLRDHYLLPFPDPDRLPGLRDKRFQVDLAMRAGIAAPRTIDAPADDLQYPVLVKSSDSARFVGALGVKGLRCDSRAELDREFERARPFSPLIQEWIPGPDTDLYLVGAYLDREGEPLGVVTCRKL